MTGEKREARISTKKREKVSEVVSGKQKGGGSKEQTEKERKAEKERERVKLTGVEEKKRIGKELVTPVVLLGRGLDLLPLLMSTAERASVGECVWSCIQGCVCVCV